MYTVYSVRIIMKYEYNILSNISNANNIVYKYKHKCDQGGNCKCV